MYKALDKRDGKNVAIKVLEVENEDTAELMKEIEILKKCNSPYIVSYKGSYEKDGHLWVCVALFIYLLARLFACLNFISSEIMIAGE